jgi:hypothetical protein
MSKELVSTRNRVLSWRTGITKFEHVLEMFLKFPNV